MANVIGHARSNHFHVKDVETFKKEMGELGLQVVDEPDGRVCILVVDDDCGCFPFSRYDEDEQGWVGVNIPAAIAPHLMDGDVCVLKEVSHMKLASLSGWALAINSEGETRSVSLDAIYDLAKEIAGPASTVNTF